MNKLQVGIIIFSIVIVITGVVIFARRPTNNEPTTTPAKELIVWGTEPESIYKEIFRSYETVANTKIVYREQKAETFHTTVTEALAAERGPDLIIASADWIVGNRDKLAPAPSSLITISAFQSAFIDLATDALTEKRTVEGKKQPEEFIWALPLWTDPLVLYWNRDIFNAASLPLPPADWFEFLEHSNKIKKIGQASAIERAGAALGRAKTIPLYKEIVSLLLLQQQADLEGSLLGGVSDRSGAAESVLRLYTDFGKAGTRAYTWNNALAEPRELFMSGKLGMMIDYISYAPLLQERAPHLSFSVAAVPQVKGAPAPIHYANIVGISIPRTSKNAAASWNFARWLVSKAQAEAILTTHAVAPVRRDSLGTVNLNPLLKEAALNAKRVEDTHPRETSAIILEMIESVADGRLTVSEAIKFGEERFQKIISP